MRESEGKGSGTRKTAWESFIKEFKERCSRERRGGAGPRRGRGRQGCPPAALTLTRGQRAGRPLQRVESGIRPQDGVPGG